MKVNFLLFLLAIFCFNALEAKTIEHPLKGVNKSKFENHISKLSTTKNDDAEDGPYCRSIVAYYVGTLQNKRFSEETYDVQFQLRLDAVEKTKHIHVKGDNWNEKYSKSQNFEFDFYYEGNRQWCDIYDDDCSASFAKKNTSFKLDLNTMSGNYFHLMNFNYFNNSFGLHKPRGKCTKHQLDTLNDDYNPDLTQLEYCICCDDYTPDDLLGCPNDKWGERRSTKKPIPTEPIPTKPSTPPPQKDISCKSVVGYFNGQFKNEYNPRAAVNVEYQTRLKIDEDSQKIYFVVDRWNSKKSNMNYFKLEAADYEAEFVCSPINKTDCFVPFVTTTEEGFYVHFNYNPSESISTYYTFLEFAKFDNFFTVNKATGQCTKNQIINYYDYTPDPKLYDYCLCCGDEYNPGPSLGCPKNPWA